MIRAIVIDDEWYNMEEISDLVMETGIMQVVGKYQDPLKLLDNINVMNFEVAFLDIEMPEMDGLTLAEKILEEKPGTRIAFVTSWNQYAVQAFDLSAVDYIMKPIRKERFQKMIEKIRYDMNAKEVLEPIVEIKCFDKLAATIGNKPIRWERTKAEELFAYLLMNQGSYIHKETILENLWPNYEPLKALPILQTTICRIRNIFSDVRKEVVLNYSGSKYCLTIHNVTCDYLEVEQALKDFDKLNVLTFKNIENAVNKYNKGFLTQEGYLWSMEKDEELRKRLGNTLEEILEYYQKEIPNEEFIKYLKLFISIFPYDDDANYKLLKILKQAGNEIELLNHSKWLIKILKEEYDTDPSKQVKEIINSVLEENN